MSIKGMLQRLYFRLYFLFSDKCCYFDACPDADNESCVCLHGGNAYCGKFREYEGRGKL